MSGLAVSDSILSAFTDSIQGLLLRSVLVVDTSSGAKLPSDTTTLPASQSRCAYADTDALEASVEYAERLGARVDAVFEACPGRAREPWRRFVRTLFSHLDAVPLASYDAALVLAGAESPSDSVAELAGLLVKAGFALKRGASLLCVINMEAIISAMSTAETIEAEKIFTFVQKVSSCARSGAAAGRGTSLAADNGGRDAEDAGSLTYRMHFIHESCIIISFRKE